MRRRRRRLGAGKLGETRVARGMRRGELLLVLAGRFHDGQRVMDEKSINPSSLTAAKV